MLPAKRIEWLTGRTKYEMISISAKTGRNGKGAEEIQNSDKKDAPCLTNPMMVTARNTAIAITADADDVRAAGLMVQRLPKSRDGEQEEEDWRRAVVLMSSITSKELLDRDLTSAKILFRLYHEDGIRLYDPRDLRHECRCSEERVSRTLRSFPREEIADMAEDGIITVTCEFCRTDYVYDEQRLDALYADAAT